MFRETGKMRFLAFAYGFAVLLVFSHGMACAGQARANLGLDARLRFEYQDGFNAKYYGDNPPGGAGEDRFLLERLRAGFDFMPADKVRFVLWMQDSGAADLAMPDNAFYNASLQGENNPYRDRCELWDAYAELMDVSGLPLNIRAGRQRLFFGDKRVFGPGEWGNSGRWIWDALRISFRSGKGSADFYYGRTMVHDPHTFSVGHRHFYESFGFYSCLPLTERMGGIAVEPFSMTKRDDHPNYRGEDGRTGPLDSWYAGFRAYKYHPGGLQWDVTYVRQFGNYGPDDIDAYGFHILLGYRLPDFFMSPGISLEYSYGSGDSDPADNEHGAFDGAFGARDRMYGRMNLFKWRNIKDAQVNLEFKPCRGLSVVAGFHKFRLASDKDGWSLNPGVYRDVTGLSGNDVGDELDIVCRFDATNSTCLQAGFGHFRPGGFTEKVASGRQADWVFVQWEYRFAAQLL